MRMKQVSFSSQNFFDFSAKEKDVNDKTFMVCQFVNVKVCVI